MKQFGAFEAKTHFSELLCDVINGDKIIITKHGVKVAMIIPFTQEECEIDPVQNAISNIKNRRQGTTIGKKLSIKAMREKGRK